MKNIVNLEFNLILKTIFIAGLTSCSFIHDNESKDVYIDNKNKINYKIDVRSDDVNFIPLGVGIADSTVHLDQLYSFYEEDGYFYILDEYVGDNSNVYLKKFNSKGEYVDSKYIGNEGVSPFRFVCDMYVDKHNIYLLDVGAQKLFYQSLNKFFDNQWSSYDSGDMFERFVPLGDRRFIFDSNNSENSYFGDHSCGVIELKEDGQSQAINYFGKIPSYFNGIGVQGKRIALGMNNTAFYVATSGFKIFEIKNLGEAIDSFNVVFSSNQFDFDSNINMSVDEWMEIRRSQRYIYGFDRLFVFRNYMLLTYRFDRRFYWLIIDLDKRLTRIVTPEFEFIDFHKVSYTPLYVDEHGILYFAVNGNEIYNYYINIKNDELINNKIKSKFWYSPEECTIILSLPFTNVLQSAKL